MGIHFTKEQWEHVKSNYTAWWEQKLNRPLISIQIRNAYPPEREEPDVPLLTQANCHRLDIPAEKVIDRIDYELSTYAFLGDAYPMVNMWSFGPSCLAGFCGAELKNDTGNVWYQCPKKDIEDIHIQYDPENVWAKRIKELYRTGLRRWEGQVVMSMPDLGGFQDVIANFTGSQELLLQCAMAAEDEDEAQEMERLRNEAYTAWMEAYKDLSSVLQEEGCPGYTDWGGIFSCTPSYILQDDFAYMIGEKDYLQYGYPEIQKACETLDHTIYHLDGVGNLRHLDTLLENSELNAIQWVYGAGQPSARHWLEVYDKIYRAGKNIECIGDLEDFQILREKYGSHLFYQCTVDGSDGLAARLEEEKDCLHSYRIFPVEQKEKVLALLKNL